MSFNFNGNIPKEIFFNNQEIKKLIYNSNVVWKKTRLPRLYTEVEYIESTGTQYIDSVYTFQSNIYNIEITAETSFTGREMCVCSFTKSDTISTTLECAWGAAQGRIFSYQGSVGGSIGYYNLANIYNNKTFINIWQDNTKRYLKVNNEDAISDNNTLALSQRNVVRLFGMASSSAYNFVGKLYSCKITDNNILVRDFIPCYRNSDGEIGLYDSINDIFYTNQGTDSFIKGKDVYTLPNEYQEVEYIESTGTQYIRTNIVPTDFFKMEFLFYTQGATSFYCAGARNTNPSSLVIYFAQSGASAGRKLSASVNGTSVFANTNGEDWSRPSTGVTYKIRISTNGDGTFSYNIKDLTSNKEFLSENNEYPIMGTVTERIFLFALNHNNKLSGTNRCYYFRLYKENELIFYGIPCYRKSDNEAGLYDIVTNTFLTNQGTGEFNIGENVN